MQELKLLVIIKSLCIKP